MQNANRPNPTGGTRGRLVRRYFLVFATLVGGSLLISILVEMAFRFQESHRNLQLIQGQMADLAAFQIQNYIDDVAKAIRLAAQPQTIVAKHVTEDYPTQLSMLLKNVPAIRDLVSIGLDGREQYRRGEFALPRVNRSLVGSHEAERLMDRPGDSVSR